MPTFSDARTGAAITVKVTPRAKKSEVVGIMDDGTIRVRIAAVPEAGAANEALVEFLAEILGLQAKQVDILGGLSSERKLISLVGITPSEVEAKVKQLSEARSASVRTRAAGRAAGRKVGKRR